MQLPLVFVLGLVSIAISYNQRMLDPLTVVLARDLAVDVSQIVLLSPAFTIPYALSQPILGPVADAIGKARVLRACLGIMLVLTAICWFVTDYTVVLILRLLMGAVGGGVIPVALALIADRTPMERRQLAMSRFMVAMVLGQLFTSPIAAYLGQSVHWHAVLLVAMALAGLGLVIFVWQIKPNPAAVRTPYSVAGAARIYGRILADPRAWACYASVFIEGVAVFGFTPHVALYVQENRFGGTTEAGYVLGGMGLGGLAYAVVVPYLVRRLSMFAMMVAGAVLLGVGLAGVAASSGWPAMALCYGITGFGFYMMHSGLQAQVSEILPEARASAVSLHAFFMFLGLGTGPIIYGWGKGLVGGSTMLTLYAATILVVGVAASTLLGVLARRRAAGG